MDGFLRDEEAADRFSGVVAIEHGERVVFQGAYGQAHRGFCVPNAIDTRFNLGSITKMFTAVAVLQLCEQGKLALDDKVSAYLPELKVGGIERITIHHLLCHSSGLGDYWNEKCKQRRSTLRTVGSYLTLIEGQQPAFEPGSATLYGNAGYLVLGGIIEAVSGRDYYEYVEEQVCRRAEMTRTAFLHLDRIADFAHGYTHIEWEGPQHPDYRTDNIFQYPVRGNPAGWLYSTAPDMLRFGAALRRDQLLSAQSRELMLAIHARGEQGERFGYGTQHVPYSQGTAVGHGGRAFGAATIFLFLPAVGYTVCVLSNYDRPADKRAFARFDQWLAESSEKPKAG
jgi:CubicO group peptidase (beta-lactamase class C family)